MNPSITNDELGVRFTYHARRGKQRDHYVEIRERALILAERICALTPGSREQSLAITALEEAVFWANAAIARRGE